MSQTWVQCLDSLKNTLPLGEFSVWVKPLKAAERNADEKHLYREEKYAAKYEINMLRCIFCGLCEEACPKDAIYLSETVAQANYSRKSFIYNKEDLLIPNPNETH